MREDEKMFQLGLGLLIVAFIMIAAFQVAFRIQEKDRARTKTAIIRTQQEYAQKRAYFSGLLRPENLRGIVSMAFPRFETIGFGKNINIGEIPLR
ncbi:MAG: hypothetical protein FWE64_02785 [Alphaproteobacteria bacterium]|nr:hypothetical protein [Alphaproteobacteria bacterium]